MLDGVPIPTDMEFDRAIGSKSLRDFTRMAWHVVEPARVFIPNWHIDAICDHLEAVTRLEIKRLVINIPPGTMKSLTCSVFWPAWSWTNEPWTKWITGSYGLISRRDSLRSRQLMESKWYQERWGDLWKPNKDDWSSIKFSNDKAGFRLAVTVAGGATGEHADHQLVDDPIKPIDARSGAVDSAKLQLCKDWWDETMSSRMVDPFAGTRTIIMQRLHDQDLAGHVLSSGDYTHLNLPMENERSCVIDMAHKCSLPLDGKGEPSPPTDLGFKDPREEGELLWKERFPPAVIPIRKREMGPRGHASQDQQRPVPSGGGIFKRDWVQFWGAYPKHLAHYIQSWDCTFKGLQDSDYVVGQVWARVGADFYLVDQVRDQMGVSATCQSVLSLSRKWKKAYAKLIEDKANGPAVIQLMQNKIPGLLPINPMGGKVARAHAVEPFWAAGNVYLPHPDVAPWVHDFIEEVVKFSGVEGQTDDQVDGMTQALVYLGGKAVSTNYKKAMSQITGC